MTKSHIQTLSLVLDKISLKNVTELPPVGANPLRVTHARHTLGVDIGHAKDMVTYISKDDLTDILDGVFSKYDIKIASSKQKVIKSTAKKAKSSKATKTAKVESYGIDGEKFTFNLSLIHI